MGAYYFYAGGMWYARIKKKSKMPFIRRVMSFRLIRGCESRKNALVCLSAVASAVSSTHQQLVISNQLSAFAVGKTTMINEQASKMITIQTAFTAFFRDHKSLRPIPSVWFLLLSWERELPTKQFVTNDRKQPCVRCAGLLLFVFLPPRALRVLLQCAM